MPQREANGSDTEPSSIACHHSTPPSIYEQSPSTTGKAKVIGIYGVPGSGKTFLLEELKHELGDENFLFFEGSEMIATLVPGGLEAFQKMNEQHETHWRQLAIDAIGASCTPSGKSAIVTGHLMFWPEGEEGQMVYTSNDLATFTHIIYLDTPPEVIGQRQREDVERTRSPTTIAHLMKWQQAEKAQLRRLCRDHRILFIALNPDSSLLRKVTALLRDLHIHTEARNLSCAKTKLDEIITSHHGHTDTIVVIDADRTLAAEDTGALFWTVFCKSRRCTGDEDAPLKSIFSSSLGYSYEAFRQAAFLYEEATNEEEYEALCENVALRVTMYSEFVSLMQLIECNDHVGIVVVSCGLRCVWQKVLEREGLSGVVSIIAGGRIADRLVVTAAVKAAVVARLQNFHRKYVWAFGDSPLDIEMLRQADQAVVVVGSESFRSKSMDDALSLAISRDGLQAYQVLLPSGASPRLSVGILPVVQFTETDLIGSILSRRNRPNWPSIHIADNKNAAKLLVTPMRDAAVAGPALRAAHRRAGEYLATEVLTSTIGMEECPISHVLSHAAIGYQLLHEPQTIIIALMRAGEPMASGVSNVFPQAVFLHASGPESVKLHHLQGQLQVLLVDSVINTGKTILELVQAVRTLDSGIRIVIVAGVIQAQCAEPSSPFYETLCGYANISLVALRRSDTKFTGSGSTDTGNRLFNTTHLA